ncbi:hypothetical protein [Granulicella sibirica]|uniref:Ribbon-helix-helix protein CopG domain-containing protein n=1 Tax=Granulicella sibirica TaxID=2479048 RepID=A0A4Q0T261_9BACT|nr:hypothetical protein [Granulicella sibirica]RXH55641.1 hypothetical protein GRAN_2498 [Granulicella sibirica]
MATAPKSPASNRATSRTVVLLRASDRKKLEALAAQEEVSSGEIIRRSLDSYESLEARIRKEEEEKMLLSGLSILQDALKTVNDSMNHTNAKLDKLHLELKALDLR